MQDDEDGEAADAVPDRRGVTAGDGFAFVSHTGEVTPSGFLPLPAGDVRDGDVVELYRESQLFDRLRRPLSFAGKCGVCAYRELCGGSRSRAYAATGDPFGSDPLCPYVPQALREDAPDGGGRT